MRGLNPYPLPPASCTLFLACLLLRGAAATELVPLEGEAVEAQLQAVDLQGLKLLAKAPISLPLEELVRWGHPRQPRGQILVVLADGGRLVTAAAWEGGAAVRFEGDEVAVLSDTFETVSLPRELVRGIVFALRKHPRERERLEEVVRGDASPAASQSATEDSTSDVVLLMNKDRVTGTLKSLAGGSLTLETQGGAVKLPLSGVEAIIFGKDRPSSAASRQSKLAVGLRDGSLVYAESVLASEENVSIVPTSGPKLEGGSVKDIALLQSFGDRFVYLSDLEPVSYRYVPYLSIEWPYRHDRNVLGEPLSVGGKRYLKGIGMHSASRLTYRLDGTYRRFDSMLALDESAGKKGSVTFGVHVLRTGEWMQAYTSEILRGVDAPRAVSVDLNGAEGLTLTVDFADRGDELDHADWLDARLVKN